MKHRIAIFGGTGFVGTALAAALTRQGHEVIVFSRHPERCVKLKVLPFLVVKFVDYANLSAITSLLSGCDVAINLVGILNESGHSGKGFREVHVQLTQQIVNAAKAAGIKRYLHMSALSANQAKGPSHYLRTKGEAEDWVHQHNSERFQVTTFRPSVIFGFNDSFYNRFAKLLDWTPGFFPLACADSLFAPIYVGDLVNFMSSVIDNKQAFGRRYDLCGPMMYTLKDIVQYVAKVKERPLFVFGLGQFFSKCQAFLFEYLPGKPFSVDNYRSASAPILCQYPPPKAFLKQLTHVEAIIPTYLGRRTKQKILAEFRQRATR